MAEHTATNSSKCFWYCDRDDSFAVAESTLAEAGQRVGQIYGRGELSAATERFRAKSGQTVRECERAHHSAARERFGMDGSESVREFERVEPYAAIESIRCNASQTVRQFKGSEMTAVKKYTGCNHRHSLWYHDAVKIIS